jgi:two-component system, response regulator, stage 0 sporulation protein F
MISKFKILYVDDEPINLMLFDEIFNEKFDVILANSGFKGLEALKLDNEIKIVISDMKMPELNGLEFIKLARNSYLQPAYFILSGYNLTEEITHALESGIILKYFLKPLNINEIEKAIESLL